MCLACSHLEEVSEDRHFSVVDADAGAHRRRVAKWNGVRNSRWKWNLVEHIEINLFKPCPRNHYKKTTKYYFMIFFLSTLKITNNGCITCACLKAPGWYSSRKSATQTRSDPSMGWMAKRRSELWCHSLMIASTRWSSASAREAPALGLSPAAAELLIEKN